MKATHWFYSQSFNGRTVAPSVTADLAECAKCEGSGRIVHAGTPGAYYRDGEKYDPPGEEDCSACDGTGRA